MLFEPFCGDINSLFQIKKSPLKITPWCDDPSSFVFYIFPKQRQQSRVVLLP
jgi:hypothetical protein